VAEMFGEWQMARGECRRRACSLRCCGDGVGIWWTDSKFYS